MKSPPATDGEPFEAKPDTSEFHLFQGLPCEQGAFFMAGPRGARSLKTQQRDVENLPPFEVGGQTSQPVDPSFGKARL